MENMRVVFVTVPMDIADKMAKAIVENRLAACSSVVSTVKSYYYWEGQLKNEHESLLILKTTMSKIDDLITFIKSEHPYDVPEIIAMPVAEGLPDYVNWVIEEMGKTAETA